MIKLELALRYSSSIFCLSVFICEIIYWFGCPLLAIFRFSFSWLSMELNPLKSYSGAKFFMV